MPATTHTWSGRTSAIPGWPRSHVHTESDAREVDLDGVPSGFHFNSLSDHRIKVLVAATAALLTGNWNYQAGMDTTRAMSKRVKGPWYLGVVGGGCRKGVDVGHPQGGGCSKPPHECTCPAFSFYMSHLSSRLWVTSPAVFVDFWKP